MWSSRAKYDTIAMVNGVRDNALRNQRRSVLRDVEESVDQEKLQPIMIHIWDRKIRWIFELSHSNPGRCRAFTLDKQENELWSKRCALAFVWHGGDGVFRQVHTTGILGYIPAGNPVFGECVIGRIMTVIEIISDSSILWRGSATVVVGSKRVMSYFEIEVSENRQHTTHWYDLYG